MGRGVFVVLEGGDGAGKSAVQAAITARLAAAGREVVATREPGGTPIGERIRDLLLGDPSPGDARTELLLFEAARAALVESVVRPALERGAVVVCDRFEASSIAYQGFGRGLGRDLVEHANAVATDGLKPDLTILLDVPVEVGLARRAGDGDANHFDREAIAFHQRVRSGFLELAREQPDTWEIVDASQPLDHVIEAAWARVASACSG